MIKAVEAVMDGMSLKRASREFSNPGCWHLSKSEIRRACESIGVPVLTDKAPWSPVDHLSWDDIARANHLLATGQSESSVAHAVGIGIADLDECRRIMRAKELLDSGTPPTSVYRTLVVGQRRFKSWARRFGWDLRFAPRRRGITSRISIRERILCLRELGWADRDICKATGLTKIGVRATVVGGSNKRVPQTSHRKVYDLSTNRIRSIRVQPKRKTHA